MVSAAVALLLAELVCRADLAAKRQRALAGRNPESLATTAVSDRRLYRMKPDPRRQFNSSGYRDQERLAASGAGAYRIAVIGDSASVQPEIPYQRLWTRRLQRQLDRSFGPGRIEVLNFAVTGYGTRQQLVQLEAEVLGYSPDALLWQFHLNDAMDPVFDGADGGLGVYYARPASALALYANKIWTRVRRSVAVRRAGLGALPIELRVQAGEWRAMDRSLATLRDVARQHDLEVFFVVLPIWPDSDAWPEPADESQRFYDRLVRRFGELGFEALDLAPAFRERQPAATRAGPDDRWHPGPEGHRVIADEVSRWLSPRLRRELTTEDQETED